MGDVTVGDGTGGALMCLEFLYYFTARNYHSTVTFSNLILSFVQLGQQLLQS